MSAASSSTIPTRSLGSAEPRGAGPGPLAGRHAVVTGAGRGIGAAIASELARLGADLTLMGRSSAALSARQGEIEDATGRAVRAIRVDVTSPAAIAAAFAEAVAERGAPLILVNNAGDAESAAFARTSPALWDRMLAVNVTSAYLCTRQMLDGAIAAGWGRIVNVASTAGLKGYAYATAYCASKHALVGLTRALAAEVVRTGVTVNAVCPGYTDTALVERAVERIVAASGRPAADAKAALARSNPMGRLIAPAEVAEAVGWLCLPGSAAMTGQTIAVAGGEIT